MIDWTNLKRGTILILNPKTRPFGAPKGAEAEFQRYEKNRHGGDAHVKWINRKRFGNHGQEDGDYDIRDFKLRDELMGDGETTCRYCGKELKPVLYGKETFKICHNCELRE